MQGDSPTGRDTRLRLVTAFVIGVASLTLEIAYTRVISFKLFYYYTYFVIGLALLGLGAASATTRGCRCSPRWDRTWSVAGFHAAKARKKPTA